MGRLGKPQGDSSLRGIASGATGDQLVLQWTFEAGKYLKSSPVVSEGKIFWVDRPVFSMQWMLGRVKKSGKQMPVWG